MIRASSATLAATTASALRSTTSLVAVADDIWTAGDRSACYVVYSVTKAAIAAAILRLAGLGRLALDDPAPDGWPGTIRQLLDHTSGARDYGSLPVYREAVRTSPSEAWPDETFLRNAREAGSPFEPGEAWAYSNTGYLLLRRRIDAEGGLATWIPSLDLGSARVAETLDDLEAAEPAPSTQLLDGVEDVRGAYDPRWVGHRALVASVDDLLGFWRSLPSAMLDPATFVPIGADAPGFVRPSYGLGVMADPAGPYGTMIGHGGGGPGYAAGVFVIPAEGAIAIVLTADEAFDAQGAARQLVQAALGGSRR